VHDDLWQASKLTARGPHVARESFLNCKVL